MEHKKHNVIVCENQIQVNNIQLAYKKQSKINVLKIPKILTLDNWIANEYQECLMIETLQEFYILNGIEEKIIWENIIINDLKKRQEKKITDITNIAQKAINANRIISNHLIHEDEIHENNSYRELSYFIEWRGEFKEECSKRKLVTKYDFINIFITLQQEKLIVVGKDILFIGLDKSIASYKKLYDELKKNNEVSEDLSNKKLKAVTSFHAFQNYEHEISAVIEWVREKESKKQNNLLIMSPALEKFQIQLLNEIDRHIHPKIFLDLQTESILNTSLKRPLSAEPIIRAALICIKINERKLLSIKELCDLLLFDNWVSDDSLKSKQYLASQLKNTKKKYITTKNLLKLLEMNSSSDDEYSFKNLSDIFKIVKNNQDEWLNDKEVSSWNTLIFNFLEIIKFGKIYNLLPFEINNLELLLKVFNQINKSKVITKKLSLPEYIKQLEYYLENFVPNKINEESNIDIYGFHENPTKEYDAIWLMNMNDNFWPNHDEFNPFLSKKIQEKNNIFNTFYHQKIYKNKIDRLSKLSKELLISFSLKDNDISLSPSPWVIKDFDIHQLDKTQSKSLIKDNQHYIDDHQAPAIEINGDKKIRSGCKTIENQNKCPAWAFYANRLGCSKYEEDEQYEITRRSEGSIVHRTLEFFWDKCRTSDLLLSLDSNKLSQMIDDSVFRALDEFKSNHNELDDRLLSMQHKFLKKIIGNWLSEEKNRPAFSIHELEKTYEVKISNLKFNIRIDRIDIINKEKKLLIDYKTSKKPISRRELFSESLTDLQLPIYACYTDIKGLSGIAIGQINRDKVNLYGILTNNSDSITKQLNSKIDNPLIKDWDALIEIWKKRIEFIVGSYISGDASVKFNEKIDFNYCDVLPLLRLAEKKYQFEQHD